MSEQINVRARARHH